MNDKRVTKVTVFPAKLLAGALIVTSVVLVAVMVVSF
jgi:hypothetical protein